MKDYLLTTANNVLPRILTQVCRDPHSPYYGCADRHWWHYKIRDFPSVILQQTGYTLNIASGIAEYENMGSSLKSLAKATCRFWNERAQLHGAFEEYYPYEKGYPPLAFSTLAVAKNIDSGICDIEEVSPGLEIAVKQLLNRFETEAANQQVAGLAALAVINKILPDIIDSKKFNTLTKQTLALQSEEGWFIEYGGPDLGYLSVTMDCLYDLLDYTGDSRFKYSLEKAFDYLAWFVLSPFGGAGMHNSRNTDYIVPYALVRLSTEDWCGKNNATLVFNKLYDPKDPFNHFFSAIDDRYWCHYIGHSLFRALHILNQSAFDKDKESPFAYDRDSQKLLSGHIMKTNNNEPLPQLLLTRFKGGILKVVWGDQVWVSDYGWLVEMNNHIYVINWWASEWVMPSDDKEFIFQGRLIQHREHKSTPIKHMALRLISFFAGYSIISVFKSLLIHKKQKSPLYYERRVKLDNNVLIIQDSITGLKKDASVFRAPRASKRHVASADSYHMEDFMLCQGVKMVEKIKREATTFESLTKYYQE